MFNLKNQKKARPLENRQGAADLRLQKDITDLSLPNTCKILFAKPDDLLNFELTIKPDEGIYEGGSFKFAFKVPPGYPHEAPKVKCLTRVYHPNIDVEGNICLNILREDWKPVLTINAVVYGLQYLLLEPNPDDPLNKEAAEVLKVNRRQFEHIVHRTMRGGSHGGMFFDRCI